MPSPAAATVMHDRRPPGARRGARPARACAEVAPGMVGAVAVGLVDDEDVADLQDAGLGRLDAVAHPGREQHEGGVGERGDLDLACPTPTVSTSDHVAAGGVEHPDRLRGRPGQPAEVAAAWPWSGCRRRGRAAWSCIRTRSPSSAPPENGEDGSTASTPTRLPAAAVAPRPARWWRSTCRRPGEPVRPTTCACPACGASAAITSRSAATRPRPARSAGPPRAASPSRARATRSGTDAGSPVGHARLTPAGPG